MLGVIEVRQQAAVEIAQHKKARFPIYEVLKGLWYRLSKICKGILRSRWPQEPVRSLTEARCHPGEPPVGGGE